MASSTSDASDVLTLLREYTQLKRMIDSCKRRNCGQPRLQQPFIPLPNTHHCNAPATRLLTATANPYVLRANRGRLVSSKYKMTFSGVSNTSTAPTVTADIIIKPPAAASKYSWSSGQQTMGIAAATSPNRKQPSKPPPLPTISSTASRLDHRKVIRKTSTKYKVVNANASISSPTRTLRQVRKYSVKYVPFSNRSLSKNSSIKRKSVFVDGRYALKRRRSVSQAEQRLDAQTNRRTKFVVIGKLLYKMSKTKLSRTGSAKMGNASSSTRNTPMKCPRLTVTRRQSAGKERIVSVRGVKFVMDPQRKTLRRCAQQSHLRVGMLRVDIGSDTYVQSQPGVLVRSPGKQLRSLANRVVNRSITHLTVKRQRSQQFCMFYNKFGKCSKRDKGDGCPYIHDSDKIAVCKRFLKGDCNVSDCTFSHRLCPLKMPVCVFFLRGRCSSDTCPYRHVNVSRDASICEDFNRGYCPLGEKCKKWHVHACPQFELSGQCDRGDMCPLRHRRKRASFADKPKTHTVTRTATTTEQRFSNGHVEGGGFDAATMLNERALPAFISLNEFGSPSSSEGIKEEITSLSEEEIRIKPKFVKKCLPSIERR